MKGLVISSFWKRGQKNSFRKTTSYWYIRKYVPDTRKVINDATSLPTCLLFLAAVVYHGDLARSPQSTLCEGENVNKCPRKCNTAGTRYLFPLINNALSYLHQMGQYLSRQRPLYARVAFESARRQDVLIIGLQNYLLASMNLWRFCLKDKVLQFSNLCTYMTRLIHSCKVCIGI